jgi:Uncharacterized conserved protein
MKGGKTMKVAVTYENGQIFQHFGHTEQFKVYDVENGSVKATTILETGANGHCGLGGFLKECDVDVLICGGIGGGARQALAAAGIELYGGVVGDADRAVEALLARKLVFDPDACCNHHGEGHHHHGEERCHHHANGPHTCGH